MPVCTNVRNPGNAASKRYGPSGKFDRTYVPVSSVGMLRFKPVSVCVTETSTPGKTAPLWSFTVPLICAVDCAQAAVQIRTRHTNPTSTPTLLLFMKRYIGPPLWFLLAGTFGSATDRFVHNFFT